MESYEGLFTPFLAKREARGLNTKKDHGSDPEVVIRIKQDTDNQQYIKLLRRETVNLLENFEIELRSQQDKNKKIKTISAWHRSMMKYLRRHEPKFTNFKKALDLNTSSLGQADRRIHPPPEVNVTTIDISGSNQEISREAMVEKRQTKSRQAGRPTKANKDANDTIDLSALPPVTTISSR